MNGFRLTKYRLLSRAPGRCGRRYLRKLAGRRAMRDFDAALRECAGMTHIDLGANVGEVTRKMAASGGRVMAFEPDPWSLARLRANGGGLGNVEITPAAAGVSDGTVALYRRVGFADDPARYSESASIVADKMNLDRGNTVEVEQVDFARYLEALDREIGVLKMDIEGAEVEILEALFARPDLLRRVRYIFAETHERMIPGHGPRVEALRRRAAGMERPRVNLDWH